VLACCSLQLRAARNQQRLEAGCIQRAAAVRSDQRSAGANCTQHL